MKKLLLTATVLLACASVLSAQAVSYKPQLFGSIRATFENDTQNGDLRFGVQNARLGVKGNASANLRYALQVELNGYGKLTVLDSYVAYGAGNFELSFGQQTIGFSTELRRGAAGFFTSTSFLGSYLTGYYASVDNNGTASQTVATLGPRDIGALLTYKSKTPVVFHASAGVFNGSGINNPVWDKYVNITAAAGVTFKGFGFVANYFNGSTPVKDWVNNDLTVTDFHQRMQIWDVEARYIDKAFRVEGEFAKRYLTRLDKSTDVLTVAVVHAMYSFNLPENKYAHTVTPMVRWDYGDNINYLGVGSGVNGNFMAYKNAHKITAGVTLGFAGKLLSSELRFNYECFLNRNAADYATNRMMHDKFTIEFFAAF